MSKADNLASLLDAAGNIDSADIGTGAITEAKIGTGAVTEAKIGTGAVTTEKLNVGQLGGRRNLIINGAMKVAQRGTSISGGTGKDFYGLDRFVFEGTDYPITVQVTHSNSQITDGNRNALKISTAGTAIGTAQVHQRIERETFRHTIGQTVTFSCLVKRNSSTVTGGTLRMIASVNANTHAFRDTPGAYPSHTVTETLVTGVQNIPTDYTRYTASFTMPAGANTTDILEIGLSFINFTGAGAWEDLFSISEMQLELGDTATPFEHRSYAEELELCKRYYQRWDATDSNYRFAPAHVKSTSAAEVLFQLRPEMRVEPTTLETTGTAGDYKVYSDGIDICTGVALNSNSNKYTGILEANASGLTAGDAGQLISSDSNGYVAFNAEL